jgi:hypothetical protein
MFVEAYASQTATNQFSLNNGYVHMHEGVAGGLKTNKAPKLKHDLQAII